MRDPQITEGGVTVGMETSHNAITSTGRVGGNVCNGTEGIPGNVFTGSNPQSCVSTLSNKISLGDESSVYLKQTGKFGNRGEVLPKMPPKLLPNFGDDPARRVRKWNKAVERKFEKNMAAMSQDFKFKTTKLDRGIRSIEEELDGLDLERSYNTSSSLESTHEDASDTLHLKFPAIPSSRRHSGRRQGSGHKCSYISTTRRRHKCHHFPCVRPHTYHTIGYRGNPEFTPWMSWEAIKESWNAPELVDNVSTSAHDVKVTPRLRTMRKEEKLRKEIERRKLENDLKRPPSWVTNYGQPMSYKQLKYPARLNLITN